MFVVLLPVSSLLCKSSVKILLSARALVYLSLSPPTAAVCLSVILLFAVGNCADCCLLLSTQLLVFCKIDAYGNPTVPGLLSLAGQMKMGRGLLMAVGLLEGDMVEVSAESPPPLSVSVHALTRKRTVCRRDCALCFVKCFCGMFLNGTTHGWDAG